ncbi:hypothetical protein ACJA28_01595 [Mesomycoplasma moatsii]|uniref:hypothetical protein n=1 Tax=Mesomycoplasma moatsii TaxID=171287 RepID=UPI000425AEBF
MSKKTYLMGLGATTILSLIVPLAVSCSKNNKESTVNKILYSFSSTFSLNDQGKNLSVTQFIDECNKTEIILDIFRKYTNINELENNLKNEGLYIEIKSYESSSSGNSVNVEIIIKDKNLEIEITNLILSGFLTNVEDMNVILESTIKQFENLVVPNLKANTNPLITSQDVFNKWYNSTDTNKNKIIYDSIVGLPDTIIQNNKYNDTTIQIENNYSNETEAKEWVNWNEDELDNNVKGTKLAIKFRFSITRLTVNGEATISKDFVFNVLGFLSYQKSFDILLEETKNLILAPTVEGQILSSKKVVEEWNKDNKSLSKYVKNLPISTNVANVIIKNVNWDNEADITERGSVLFVSIEIQMGSLKNSIQSKVKGFTSVYTQYNNQIQNKVQDIQLSLKPSSQNLIVSEINNNNWTEHILGIPEQNEQYQINNLSFDYTNGDQGELIVNFYYSWTPEEEYQFNIPISKRIIGFTKNSVKALENYSKVVAQVNKTSFLDDIQVKGTNKNQWLTSYFGYDLGNNYSSPDLIKGIKRLWNIPDNYFGVIFKITNIKYSETDSSLSTNELKIAFEVKNKYDNTNIFAKEFIVSGFFDPFEHSNSNNKLVSLFSVKDNGDFNKRDISKMSQVDSEYKDPNNWNGTFQSTWPAYGYSYPYGHYANGCGSIDPWAGSPGEASSQTQWTNYAGPRAKNIIENLSSNRFSVMVNSTFFIKESTRRYGNNDSDGTCPATIGVNYTISTKAKDNYGNLAIGKYSDKIKKNIRVWFYFKNRYWNG